MKFFALGLKIGVGLKNFSGIFQHWMHVEPSVRYRTRHTLGAKDVRFLKIAHFEKYLEIKNICDLDKNFYGNSHCVNAFQASRGNWGGVGHGELWDIPVFHV